MSAVTPDQLDEVAASLAKAYQRAGVFCVIVRNVGTDGMVRAISPQREGRKSASFCGTPPKCYSTGPARFVIRVPSDELEPPLQ